MTEYNKLKEEYDKLKEECDKLKKECENLKKENDQLKYERILLCNDNSKLNRLLDKYEYHIIRNLKYTDPLLYHNLYNVYYKY